MALYTVHVPEQAGDRVSRADRTVFVREGFSGVALVFGLLFLLWHRLWLAAGVWVVATCALVGGSWLLHLPAAGLLALMGVMHLFLGVEGNDLRRWRLERRRFRFADVVSGWGRDEAEIGFFGRQPDGERPLPAVAASRIVARPTTPAVIGMFPGEDAP